jgi:hypothetical protein
MRLEKVTVAQSRQDLHFMQAQGLLLMSIYSSWTFFFNSHSGGGVQTGSTRHVGHFWPIVPTPGDCENGEFGGMKIGRGNRSTRRKPTPAPLCQPQIPLDQTRVRIQAAAVEVSD